MRSQMADLNLVNDPVSLEAFREYGPVAYVPHSYRPSVHHPLEGPPDPALASDLCFIGTAFPSRISFFEAMNLDGIDVLLGGSKWGELDPASTVARFVGSPLGEADCVDNAQAIRLYQHAKAGINLYRREVSLTSRWDGRADAMGPREIEMAATGLFFLRGSRAEGDRVLSMLPTFGDPHDASQKLRWWLVHDAEREEAAVKARAAIADRTFVNSAKRLLGLIEKL